MPFGFPEAPHFLAGDLGLSQLGKKKLGMLGDNAEQFVSYLQI